MSRASLPPPDPASGREAIIEFTRVGDQMRVAAIDVETGVEAVAFGPAKAARADLERLALNKLRYVTRGEDAPDAAPPARPGRLV